LGAELHGCGRQRNAGSLQQDGNRVDLAGRDRQVQPAVAVEIGCKHSNGPGGCFNVCGRPERPVAVAQKNGGDAGAESGYREIHFAISV